MNTITILELIIILIPWGSMEPAESKAEVEAYHYFYSAKQNRAVLNSNQMTVRKHPKLEVFIGGKFIRYSEATRAYKPAGKWDDYRYLGVAPKWYIRVNGKVQHDDLRAEL